MKKLFTVLLFLAILASEATSQFVEEFRSLPSRRPPASLTAQIDGYRVITDINGNGSPDIIRLRNDTLFVRDGSTREMILRWPVGQHQFYVVDDFHNRPPGSSFEEVEITYIVGYSQGNSSSITLYEIDDNPSIQTFNNMRFIGIADFDNGGKSEILAYDQTTGQSVTLGYTEADIAEDNVPNYLHRSPPVQADYQLGLKFQSTQKRELLRRKDPLESSLKYDFNGDGNADMVLFVENDAKETVGIEVIDLNDNSKVWGYDFDTNQLDELQGKFHGFFDINGDNEMELLFGQHTVVTMDGTLQEIDPDFEILMIRDIDNDGFRDIIGRNWRDSTVQVWGKVVATSLSPDAPANNYQFSTFPNPFKDVVNFDFTLPEPAQVKLEIIDALGRVLAVPLDQQMTQGRHLIPWTNHSESGLFYSRLTVDKQITIQPIFNIQ